MCVYVCVRAYVLIPCAHCLAAEEQFYDPFMVSASCWIYAYRCVFVLILCVHCLAANELYDPFMVSASCLLSIYVCRFMHVCINVRCFCVWWVFSISLRVGARAWSSCECVCARQFISCCVWVTYHVLRVPLVSSWRHRGRHTATQSDSDVSWGDPSERLLYRPRYLARGSDRCQGPMVAVDRS